MLTPPQEQLFLPKPGGRCKSSCAGTGRSGAHLPAPGGGPSPAAAFGRGGRPPPCFPGEVPGEVTTCGGGNTHPGACGDSGAECRCGLAACRGLPGRALREPRPRRRARAAGWGGRRRFCPGGRRGGGRSSCGGSRWWAGAAGWCWPWRGDLANGGAGRQRSGGGGQRSGGDTPSPAAPGRPLPRSPPPYRPALPPPRPCPTFPLLLTPAQPPGAPPRRHHRPCRAKLSRSSALPATWPSRPRPRGLIGYAARSRRQSQGPAPKRRGRRSGLRRAANLRQRARGLPGGVPGPVPPVLPVPLILPPQCSHYPHPPSPALPVPWSCLPSAPSTPNPASPCS